MSAESNPDITKTALTDRRYKTSPMVAPVTKILRNRTIMKNKLLCPFLFGVCAVGLLWMHLITPTFGQHNPPGPPVAPNPAPPVRPNPAPPIQPNPAPPVQPNPAPPVNPNPAPPVPPNPAPPINPN